MPYDNEYDWSCPMALEDAKNYANLTWGYLSASVIWPDKNGLFRICDGINADTGEVLKKEELPSGAYFI